MNTHGLEWHLTKRIHDIAQELGIASKVIIDRCIAEGVPADLVKDRMAIVKPGLEASIREWLEDDDHDDPNSSLVPTSR